MPTQQDLSSNPVSFRRRLGAVLYDLIAVIAVLFFTTLPIVIALEQDIAPGNPFYFCFQLTCAFFYFGFCWTRGGQTLGMAAWKISLVGSKQQRKVTTPAALIRFLVAVSTLGLALLSALLRRDRLAWHDRISHTHLEHVKTKQK